MKEREMECIEFFQVFIIIIIIIMTLLCMRCRSLTSSSSSSAAAADTDIPPLQEKYDVFLSFRGEDTRDTFISHLYEALCRKKIETYIDYRLVRGGELAPALLEAIQRSTILVIIFSKNYASSTWCLDELVHILECKEKNGQLVIPIFYDISPSDVRKKQGSYALAFHQHKCNKVHKWRVALTQAANLSGFDDSEKTESEAALVNKVVDDIWTKLIHESSCDLKGLVGIKSRIQQIESLLCLGTPGVLCVGIWGMGGIGKTTLAEAVFHRNSSKFEACSLLKNVREKSEQTDGLEHLEKTLLSDILKEKDVSMGSTFVRQRLSRTKVLIVFDDVTDSRQIERLTADHVGYGPGSRIIITTRDRSILMKTVEDDKIYKLEELKRYDALQLFRFHAFKDSSSTTDYTDFSAMVVDNAGGNPLALKVMGSSFLPFKSKQEWEDQLNNLKRFQNKEIKKVLRISYHGLEENEKEIFLDIACFHKGNNRNDVKRMLDIRGFFGEVGIKVLIQRSLISISKWESIEMHDLLQEMGRAIVREPCIEERSRLFITEDVYQALTNDQRDGHVHAISFHWSNIEKLHLKHANFEKMYQLIWLRVRSFSRHAYLDLPNSLKYLDWEGCPLKSLPSKFSAQNLVVVNMPFCKATGAQLWTEEQSPMNLKWITLTDCEHLTEVPNLSRSIKIEHIDLSGCRSLVEIPSYFQHLSKLTYLGLRGCKNLKYLPEMPCHLEFLDLSKTAIEEMPSSIWSHEKISHLDITYCKRLKSLPNNTCKLKLSGSLSLNGCISLCEFRELPTNTRVLDLSETLSLSSRNLVSLPTNIWKLKSLESLDLSSCSKFENFPEISEAMEHLEFLNLSGTAINEVPPSIGNLVGLRKLDLSNCKNLEVVPDHLFCLTSLQELNMSSSKIKRLPASIKQAAQLSHLCLRDCKSLEPLPELPPSLERLDLSWCFKFKNFPEITEAMEHLEFLNLSGTSVKEVPPAIGSLVGLRKLDLSDCKNLEVVPDHLFCLTSLQELNLGSTKIKIIPTSIKQAAQLSHLCLIGCKSLKSLPELPPLLQCLKAGGCTSLKTVSSSSTAITQGWEEYIFSRGLHEKHIFSDCSKLDENARSNIMADAQLRIMRMAIASSKFKEDRIEEKIGQASYEFEKEFEQVAIRCSGYEIPKWFSHQSEGCSIKIELPRDWFSTDFLGFALSLVVVPIGYMKIGCKYIFKTSNGESHEVNHPFLGSRILGSEEHSLEVFVWWYNTVFEEVVEGAPSPTAFYNRFTEVNVDFNVWKSVEKCGICLLYGKDAEMIKQRALYAQDA